MLKTFVILILFIVLLSMTGTQRSEATVGNTPTITSLIIHFDKENALFEVDYKLDTIPKFYVLLFGGNIINEKIAYMFSNFDYDVVKIDQDKTILNVKNISRFDKDNGFYLHDKQAFNITYF